MPAQIGEVTSRRWKCGICGTVGTVKICVMQFGMSLKRTSPSIFTVLYCTVLFSSAFYCAALYCAVFICILLCCVVLCCFQLYFTVLCCTAFASGGFSVNEGVVFTIVGLLIFFATVCCVLFVLYYRGTLSQHLFHARLGFLVSHSLQGVRHLTWML